MWCVWTKNAHGTSYEGNFLKIKTFKLSMTMYLAVEMSSNERRKKESIRTKQHH